MSAMSTGEWAGDVTQLIADREEVRVQVDCVFARFPQLP